MHHVPSEEMDWVSTVAVGLALDELRAEPRKHESMEMEIYSNDAAGEDAVIAVVDTNYLISHLPLLRALRRLIDPNRRMITLVIPSVVLLELDGLKNSNRTSSGSSRTVGSFARLATTWLLDVLPTSASASTTSTSSTESRRATIRGQRKDETDDRESKDNDARVLHVATEARSRGVERVVLLSDDKILCLRARFEGITTISTLNDLHVDAMKLLQQIDPMTLAPPPPTGWPREGATLSSPSSRLAPSLSIHSPPPLPRTTSLTPLPLGSHNSMMQIDSGHLPPLTPLRPPAFSPARSVEEVFAQIDVLLTYLLALPLYRHVFLTLSLEGGHEKAQEWMEDLSDWREWNLLKCLAVLVRWWHDGGLRGLCERGLEKEAAAVRTAREQVPVSTRAPSSRRPSATTWTIDQRLELLLDAIRMLERTFSSRMTVSQPLRVEVILEQVVFLIEGVYGGATANAESTLGDAKAMARGWVADLERVGFIVDATPFLP